MALQLNTSTSIVDFLKSQNKPSDSSSIGSLYESSGLSDRLGTYVGSGSQNTALLKSLSSPTSTGAVNPTTPVQDAYDTTSGLLTDYGRSQGLPEVNAPKTTAPSTIGTSGLTADQAYSSIPQAPSADEILNNVLNSAGFQNFQQKQSLNNTLATGDAEAQKMALEQKTAADTKSFVNSMGRRGLYFSGETQDGLQSLVESLAASKLGVDRKLAGDLLNSDLDTKQQIIDQVSDLVKEAQQGRKEAIAALEKVGLTVIGNEVVPTLAAASADRAERNALLAQQREERLQISSDRSYQLAIEAGNRAAAAASKGTADERIQSTIAEYASRFVVGAKLPNGIPVLDAEGKLTPEAFQMAITDAPSEGLSRQKFIENFGYLFVGADGKVSTVYGLTPAELGLVKAEVR